MGFVCRWLQEQISHLDGELGTEGADHILEASLLCGDAPSGELGFYLRKPDLWISRPEWWQFDTDRSQAGRGVLHHVARQYSAYTVDLVEKRRSESTPGRGEDVEDEKGMRDTPMTVEASRPLRRGRPGPRRV